MTSWVNAQCTECLECRVARQVACSAPTHTEGEGAILSHRARGLGRSRLSTGLQSKISTTQLVVRGTHSGLVVEFVILYFIVCYGLFVVFNLSLYMCFKTNANRARDRDQERDSLLLLSLCRKASNTPRQLFASSFTILLKIMPKYVFAIGIFVPNLLTFSYSEFIINIFYM